MKTKSLLWKCAAAAIGVVASSLAGCNGSDIALTAKSTSSGVSGSNSRPLEVTGTPGSPGATTTIDGRHVAV